jgi:hypothetical protein
MASPSSYLLVARSRNDNCLSKREGKKEAQKRRVFSGNAKHHLQRCEHLRFG